ncbi:MAG: ferrochelatase [Omnitrophica WOR_2 bacterium]
METIAVLLMAYGSPESIDELEPYLLDIRGGRTTSPELVAEIRSRYLQIGGRSPLLDITRAQAQALEQELNRRFEREPVRFRAYVGMRHWQPRIREAVAQIHADGIKKVVGLVMAPHQSRMSSGAYFEKLNAANIELGSPLEIIRIDSWHEEPGLIDALAENAAKALSGFDAFPYVIFSAHSLPERILAQGDPYDRQLRRTAVLVAERLALREGRWQFCYQSAGQSSETWLGPAIEKVIAALAQNGEKNILVVPVGFVCDHVEILYDLDVVAKKVARQNGAHLERCQSLNITPAFISALADIVGTHCLCTSTAWV